MAMINGYHFKSSRIHNYISYLRVCAPLTTGSKSFTRRTMMKRLLISRPHSAQPAASKPKGRAACVALS